MYQEILYEFYVWNSSYKTKLKQKVCLHFSVYCTLPFGINKMFRNLSFMTAHHRSVFYFLLKP